MITKNITLLLGLIVHSNTVISDRLTVEQRLGKQLFTDINLSINRNQSCESCHSLSRIEVPSKTRSGLFKIKKQVARGFVDSENVQDGNSVSNG